MTDLAAKLDELIQAVRNSSDADRCISVRGVADLLDRSLDYTRDVVVKRPDFPAPIVLEKGGHPRWLRSDVLKWLRSRQSDRA